MGFEDQEPDDKFRDWVFNDDDEDAGDEGVEAKGKKTPSMPTDEEVEQHNLTHAQFRDWCEHCVRGKAQGESHRYDKKRGSREMSKPMIAVDYMDTKSEKHRVRHGHGREDDDTEGKADLNVNEDKEHEGRRAEDMPMLSLKDRQTG